MEQEYTLTTLSFAAGRKGELFTTKKDKELSVVSFTFLTAQEYKKLTRGKSSLWRATRLWCGAKKACRKKTRLRLIFGGEGRPRRQFVFFILLHREMVGAAFF